LTALKWLVLVFILLKTLPSFAQQGATAELTGRVSSAGQALPGVTITLDSDGLQSSRTTSSGENGGYLFALLPPADYRLRFDLAGFSSAERRLQISLAGVTRVDADLQPAAMTETITVESSHAVAPAGAAMALNARASHLEKMPGSRDVTAAVLLSSNATAFGPHNRIVIAGAPSWDSLYLIDGVAVSEYLTGQPHNLFIEDAIEEIAVQTGAVSAEYGRFTGGVVTTLTKRGGNEFRGSLRDTATNAAWTRRTRWIEQPAPLDHIDHKVEATLGGFLLKDRLWFFSAGRKAKATSQSFTTPTNIAYEALSEEQRWDAKLTAEILPRHSVIASYTNTLLEEQNVTDTRGSGRVVDLGALIPDRSQPVNLLALTYEGIASSKTFAEIHVSQKRYALRGNGGRSRDRIIGTLIVARNLNANMNAPLGCGICGDDARNSNSLSAKTSHYTDTRFGNHTVVMGAEGFRENRRNAGTRSASEFNIQAAAQITGSHAYPRFDSTSLIVWNRPHPSTGPSFKSRTAYVNDRWDIGRLSVNLGMRYDRNHASDGVGQLIAADGNLSPRFSATFDLRDDGRQRLMASWGRFASKILESGGAPQQIGIFDQFGWRYLGPPINVGPGPLVLAPEALARLFAWFDSVGGVQNRQYLTFFTDPIASTAFSDSLKSPAVDERTFGYTMQFRSGFVRADYVERNWRNFYAARVDTTTGQSIDEAGNKLDVAWVINDDKETIRSYRAVQLQGTWRKGHASVGGGYTFSKLRGNDDEEEGALNAPRNLPLRAWYPEFLGYPSRRPIGYLLQDQRHRARVWMGYTAPVGRGLLSTFLLQSFDSGHPYSAVAVIDPTGLTPGTEFENMPANPGYVLNQIKTGAYYFSQRGAFRTDDIFSTDLAMSYEIPYRGLEMFLKADVLNIFNNAAVDSVDTEVITRFGGGALSGLRAFNPFTETPIEGVHYRLSPSFGQPTGPESYQRPRTFRLSFGARF
jgi:hypothetical protein